MNYFLKIVGCMGVIIASGCASEPETHSTGAYGPPSMIQGIGPDTGIGSFKGSGNWGPGNPTPQPSLPGGWNSGFKGY